VSTAQAGSGVLGVLIVDDQVPFRAAVRSLLDADDSYCVIGEAADGEEALRLTATLRPELILMDVRLPGMDGVEATRRILDRHPAVTVILVSTHREGELPADLLACGAAGFVRKEMLEPAVLQRLLRKD
jgi:two-component system, NarL family, invasion response regulator UvrY